MNIIFIKYLCFLCLLICGSSAFGEVTRKTTWRDVGCSSVAQYVTPRSGARKIYVKAQLSCPERARLLGFDVSVCNTCNARSNNDSASTPNTPSADPNVPDARGTSGTGGDGNNKGHGNNGHGNDPDGNDSSNPGNSNNGDGTDADGSAGKGKGVSK